MNYANSVLQPGESIVAVGRLHWIIYGWAIFFLVITPVALVGRWRGRDELRLRRRAGATSHWIDRERPGPQPESFRNQF